MGIKISNLPAIVVPALSDVFPVVQNGVTYKETCTQLATLIAASGGQPLTKTDDTNVTLTLGGSPTTALLNATSLALGWTGILSIARGGTGAANLSGFLLTTTSTGQTTAMTLATATPSNTALTITATDNTTISSGLLDALSGTSTINSASGGSIAGVTGNVFATGTLSGSSNVIGVVGGLVLTGGTINGGTVGGILASIGGTSPTQTDMTNTFGIGISNVTAAVLNTQFYCSGSATYLIKQIGVPAYYTAAGVSAGSWGNGTPPIPGFVAAVKINNITYYIPLVAQNT